MMTRSELEILWFIVGFNGYIFWRSFTETKYKKNAFGLTRPLIVIGSFVWADAVILSVFWIVAAVLSIYLQDWLLFWFIASLFWVVRSLGEIVYWINQQFSNINRNPPKSLLFHQVFHDDSIWFIHQVFWQCVLIFSLVLSYYLGHLWLG